MKTVRAVCALFCVQPVRFLVSQSNFGDWFVNLTKVYSQMVHLLAVTHTQNTHTLVRTSTGRASVGQVERSVRTGAHTQGKQTRRHGGT